MTLATESPTTRFIGRYKGFVLCAVQRRGEWVGVAIRLKFIWPAGGKGPANKYYTKWHRTLYGAVCAAKAAVRRGV